ncbi:hypothetical protein QUA54_11250 [Microcoleus sp. MOSTC5]
MKYRRDTAVPCPAADTRMLLLPAIDRTFCNNTSFDRVFGPA